VRTEDDLRAALTSLERHAPHPARVLPSHEVKASRGLRSPKGFRWIAGASAVLAVLAGVVTAVTVPGGVTSSHIRNGPVASAPANAAPHMLRAKLLAAFAAASGQIVYEHSTWTVNGSGATAMDSWYYPWQARQGQVVRDRRLSLNADGTPFQDVENIYRMPAPGSVPAGVGKAVRAKLKSPLLSGIVAAYGETIDVEYGNKTWSDDKHQLLLDNDPGAPVELARQVGVQHWTVVGTTTLEGHRVIELTWQVAPGSRSYLWVDASTYLPLREESSFREGKAGGWVTATFRDDYRLLPATQASVATLTPPIPAGFRQTPHQVLPSSGGGGVG
jgi:hypothetical protein